jgi:DNA mismatch repair protein MutS2
MKLYPESASYQLEFDKIKNLLTEKCRSEYAKTKASDLRIHTRKEFIELQLKQSHEYKQLVQNGINLPNDYILNLSRELKLLNIQGAMLVGEELGSLRKLVMSIEAIFRWFDTERRSVYTGLAEVISVKRTTVHTCQSIPEENRPAKDV